MMDYHRHFREQAEDLSRKIAFLITYMDKRGYLEEHRFTFPDGDCWEAEHLDEQNKTIRKE